MRRSRHEAGPTLPCATANAVSDYAVSSLDTSVDGLEPLELRSDQSAVAPEEATADHEPALINGITELKGREVHLVCICRGYTEFGGDRSDAFPNRLGVHLAVTGEPGANVTLVVLLCFFHRQAIQE